MFENLFNDAPSGDNLFEYINKNSLEVKKNAIVEPATLRLNKEGRFQFIRHGYFIRDTRLSKEKLVFNRTVSLKSSYKK